MKFFLSVTITALMISGTLAGQAQAETTLRIGYQKSSTLLTLLKRDGELEKILARQGVTVSWHEFTSGLPLLEALNTGNVDITADVADTVPIFARAAGANFTYYAREAPSPQAQAILVPAGSGVRSVADLKGKKIAVTKAAGSHYLLLMALRQAGLSMNDVTPAWLTPADGSAAFENGSVAAWVTWEPYVASAVRQQHARVLLDGQGLASYQRYYLAATPYVKAHPKVVSAVYQALDQESHWLKDHPKQAAEALSPLWGDLPVATIEQANSRRSYQLMPVRATDLKAQQQIADTFFQQKTVPQAVNLLVTPTWQPR